jgi:hypothetical protein
MVLAGKAICGNEIVPRRVSNAQKKVASLAGMGSVRRCVEFTTGRRAIES